MPLQVTIYRAGSPVPALPGSDTFHSAELFRIYEATPGYNPLLLVAERDGRPVAKLLAVVRRSVRLTPPAFIHRCEVYGTGEYFVPADERETLFDAMLLGAVMAATVVLGMLICMISTSAGVRSLISLNRSELYY